MKHTSISAAKSNLKLKSPKMAKQLLGILFFSIWFKEYSKAFRLFKLYIEGDEVKAIKLDGSWNKWMLTRS